MTLNQLFEEQSQRIPQNISVRDDGEHHGGTPHQLTYEELDRKSTALARVLVNCGIGCEDRVLVALHRCAAVLVVLLGKTTVFHVTYSSVCTHWLYD